MVGSNDIITWQEIIPASYVIYKDNSTIKAINGTTRKIDYSGIDTVTVIQSAINALPATGGEIYIKNGSSEYILTDSLKNNGKRLHINSDYAILNSASGKYAFEIDATDGVVGISVNKINSVIKNLVIKGNSVGNGVRIFDCMGTTVENIYINRPVKGIVLEKGSYFVEDCDIRHIRIYNPIDVGIAIGNSNPGNYVSYVHNNFENIKIDLATQNTIGILITDFNFSRSIIKDLHIWSKTNNVTGIKVATAGYLAGTLFINIDFEDNGTHTGLTGVDFTGSYINTPTIIPRFAFIGWGSNVRVNNPNNRRYCEIDGELLNHVLSSTFVIDLTGVKTITIPHGLPVTPNVQDCYLTVIQNTLVDDWAYNMLKIVSTDAKNVTVKINISTASVTVGATAKLALRVGNP